MPLLTCRRCGEEVPVDATKCPHCGARDCRGLRGRRNLGTILLVLAALFVVFIVVKSSYETKKQVVKAEKKNFKSFASQNKKGIGNVVITGPGGTAGQIVGSGKPQTRDFEVKDFVGVEVGGAFTVEITHSEKFKCSITADDNIVDRIRALTEGGTLHVYLDPGSYVTKSGLRAVISMPKLEEVKLNGSTTCSVSGFKSSDSLKALISGTSQLKGEMAASDVKVIVVGLSQVALRGSADELTIRASGSSSLDLGDFIINRADVILSGASTANLNVKEKLGFDLTGASRLNYRGGPKIEKAKATGASSVSRQP